MASSEHYFSTTPTTPDQRHLMPVILAGREYEVLTSTGVFSAERLDLGTRVLLREVPVPPQSGALLDIGCGWGPIALTMGLQAPQAQIWAVDVNDRALSLAKANAGRLGISNIQTARPELVPTELRFAEIWSNPPIRVGKNELHSLLLTWLPRLEPGGVAFLVVQRNLGADSLQAWLPNALAEHTGTDAWIVTRYGSAKGFRVLQIASPNDEWTQPGA